MTGRRMLAGCRKFFVMLSLIVGCFHAVNVLAVGLGDLEVNSTLSEPLDATIQLLGLEGLDESQILATLGTPADFDRANMERVGLIDDILMEVIVFDADQGLLLLTSDEPVEEPFLSMVISLRWPNGRLLRDYTVLIDLPLFISNEPEAVPVDIPETPAPVLDEPEPVEPVQEVPVQQPRTLSSTDIDEDTLDAPDTPEPVADSEPEPEPTQVASNDIPAEVVEELAEDVNEDDAVVIQSGDTLYDIAATIRPDTSVSVEQTMLAIQRNNPDAFIDNDINRIRVGQVLRIPSIQDIASIDQTQALNQIALQNQASTTQPLGLSDNDPAGAQQGPDELTILGGDEGTNSLSGDSDLSETIAALENQLAISEENLDTTRLENQELRARYTELEDQIEILQNIIAMQDERLAQLQANLAASATEIEEPVAAQPQQVVNNAQTDDSLMGQLSSVFENTLVLVASLVGLILLVVGFLVWRRQATLAEIDEFDLGGTAVAAGPKAFDTEEPDGASAGFLAAIKSRFSNEEDEDVIDDTVDEYDEEGEGGLLSKLKGIFSRSSDDDDEFYDDVEDDVYEEEKEEEGESESEESATEDVDGLDEQEDEEEDTDTALAFDDDEFISEESDEEVVDDIDDSVDAESNEDDTEETEDSVDDDLEEEALLDNSDNDIEIDIDEDVIDEVEENEDAEVDAEADVEALEFDVSDVSSFEEESKSDSTEIADDDVIEIDEGEEISVPEEEEIPLGTQSSAEDPLAAALEEIDAEADQETDSADDSEGDDLDFGNIDIDDSLFEEKESEEIVEPITDRDESSTKLDLAVAYEAMGDLDGAREILNEVIEEGNEEQIAEAKKLLEKWEQS